MEVAIGKGRIYIRVGNLFLSIDTSVADRDLVVGTIRGKMWSIGLDGIHKIPTKEENEELFRI